MENNKVITKNNKIIKKNKNLFQINGKEFYFYIDKSVNRSEYIRLNTLIEKNGGINFDYPSDDTINLTSLQTIHYPKNDDKNYKVFYHNSQFIYDSVEKNGLQNIKNYRVGFLKSDNMMMIKSSNSLDEDDTITSSMTNKNNQDVDEKNRSIINEKNNTKSKGKLVNQPVDSDDDDESSDSAVDQVSSTQSSQASKHLSVCLISNDSLESTPINKTESDLDEDSSSKPQARLARNPFFKKKNKQADSPVDNNKSREIKRKIDDENSEQMDNTSDIKEKKSKAKKYPPEKLDDHLDNMVSNPFFKKKNRPTDSTVDNNKSCEIIEEIYDL